MISRPLPSCRRERPLLPLRCPMASSRSRPLRRRAARQRRAGFTLTELMIVLLIAGTASALAIPAVQSARLNERVFRAAGQVVRLARRAQGEAQVYGRAHLIRVVMPAAETGRPVGATVRVYRGTSNGCATTSWPAIVAGPACGLTNSQCAAEVDFSRGEWNSGGTQIRMIGPGRLEYLDFCYSGQGTPQFRSATALADLDRQPWQIDNPEIDGLRGGFQFAFAGFRGGTRTSWGTATGSIHAIVVPWGATARHMRGGSVRIADYKTILGVEADARHADMDPRGYEF